MVKEIERDILKLEKEIQEKRFARLLSSGKGMAEFYARVEGLKVQSRDFGWRPLLVACENRGDPLLIKRLSSETFVGNLERIWGSLVRDDFRIIGIHGMGGVGKTTLAMHIHDLVLERTEDRVYWVKLSPEFSIKKSLDEIAKAIGLSICAHDDNKERRAAELNRALTQRKGFVLILDNVCEDIDLQRVGYPLHLDGCRLMITTRSLQVCRRIGCQEKFEVKPLDEDEAWELFKETFGRETILSPQVEGIAKQMVRNQGGLPQGIINLARKMRGVTDVREWRNVLAEVQEFLARERDYVD